MNKTATRLTRMLLLSAALLGVESRAAVAHPRETGFLDRTVTVQGTMYHYQVYVPAAWNQTKKWPVVLFLHGAGERGEDNEAQAQVGIGKAIRQHPERFPCVVVMPQCRRGVWWSDADMEAQALAALEQTIKEFNGDLQRVYLTGLSMGGYGTWLLAAKYPGKFAALAPICGGVKPPAGRRTPSGNPAMNPSVDPYKATAQKIGQTPVWVFHGADDHTVPVSESRSMVEAVKAAGGHVKYNEYPGVGHNSWDRAYAEPDFMPWLLSQRRKIKAGG